MVSPQTEIVSDPIESVPEPTEIDGLGLANEIGSIESRSNGSSPIAPDEGSSEPKAEKLKKSLTTNQISNLSATNSNQNFLKPRKLVGFAPEPEEDLNEHHRYLEERRREKLRVNPFWKIPAELSYLDRTSTAPKVSDNLPTVKTSKSLKLKDIPDRPTRPVKEISTINNQTIINFHYFEINFPLLPNRIMVDVKYASITTMDMSKLAKYSYNITDSKIGFGYDFVGIVSKIGKGVDSTRFSVGTRVFGVICPSGKRGVLQTCIVVEPSDILIPITDEDYDCLLLLPVRLDSQVDNPFIVDEEALKNDQPKAEPVQKPSKLKLPPKASYEIEDILTPLAKFCTFGSIYCRAQQALSRVNTTIRLKGNANILINGADTTLGYTLVQTIASSLYSRDLLGFNLVLVVAHKSIPQMEALITHLGASDTRKFNIVSFDKENDDLFVKGEKIPIKYKPLGEFALDVLLAVLAGKEPSSLANPEVSKLDLFVDIVGSKKMFQTPINMAQLPVPNTEALSRVFGNDKDVLFLKLMKAKSSGSSYVAYRDFQTPEPTYLTDQKSLANKSIFNPWTVGWTLAVANQFVSKYNYYEAMELEIKPQWVLEALQLVQNGEFRIKVDTVLDWRNNFRRVISKLQQRDSKVVFQIETF